jgi:N-acyl-D-aspartate/D-glutamate deacylase
VTGLSLSALTKHDEEQGGIPMLDMRIVGGTIVDGTGGDPYVGDVSVKDGVIIDVRRTDGAARDDGVDATETIDAAGRIVTPGFVDIHTHYDGQVSWDPLLDPSSGNGVTTVVSGNCGVGFAPVRPGTEEWLIALMEGVEDIPGTALTEGITWGWESFPEYLDVIGERHLAIDFGVQVPHGSVRAYAMGDRGARNEAASPEDIERMAAIVQEAVEAGALGFSTSRTIAHRAMDGEPVPGTYAAEDELFALGRAMAAGGRGVFELAPAGSTGDDLVAPRRELDWMQRLSKEVERPVSFALVQVDTAPDQWREVMDLSAAAYQGGAALYPQVAARPFGMLIGFPGHHAFTHRPSYRKVLELPTEDRAGELAKPSVRAAILSEDDLPVDPFKQFDSMHLGLQLGLDKVYSMGDPLDYEPTPDKTVAAMAAAAGVTGLEMLYDLMLADDARAMLLLPFFNYQEGNHDAIREMLLHPAGVSGLSDGGAHCGMICDATYPTFLLTHWARDRVRGEKLPLPYVVKKQTADTAALFGLNDRGVVAAGKKADLNVIDFDALRLLTPRMVHDLPAGGRRLVQGATGYTHTIVSGVVTRRDGVDTGARPGTLVRGAR